MKLLDIVTGPWAIQPAKLLEIQAIYATHLRGDKIDLEAVEKRLGRPLNNEPKGYEIRDGVAAGRLGFRRGTIFIGRRRFRRGTFTTGRRLRPATPGARKAHQLRNPLAIAEVFAGALLQHLPELPPEGRIVVLAVLGHVLQQAAHQFRAE